MSATAAPGGPGPRGPEPGVLPDELVHVVTDRWTAPWWEAFAAGRLVVPTCGACGTRRFPPTPFCPTCRSQDLRWEPVAPRGRIYSFTVIRHAVIPPVAEVLPLVVALVEPDGAPGCRLVGNVVGVAPEAVAVDMPVRIEARLVRDGVAVPRFRPAGPGAP